MTAAIQMIKRQPDFGLCNEQNKRQWYEHTRFNQQVMEPLSRIA